MLLQVLTPCSSAAKLHRIVTSLADAARCEEAARMLPSADSRNSEDTSQVMFSALSCLLPHVGSHALTSVRFHCIPATRPSMHVTAQRHSPHSSSH